MKKYVSNRLLPVFCVGLMWLLSLPDANSQCECGTDPSTGEPVFINPGAYYHKYTPVFDANGYVSSYSYSFQFPCGGAPLQLVEMFTYIVLYREKGTTDWQVHYTYISDGDFTLEVGPLAPCKVYEMRVTCPRCDYVPFQIVCNAYDQAQAYLTDPNNTLNNVSQIWEVCYDGIGNKTINDFAVGSVNPASNEVVLQWDHLSVPASYEISYKKATDILWTTAGTTTSLNFTLGNLTPCTAYKARVRAFGDCCDGLKYSSYQTLDFVMTDCMPLLAPLGLVTGNSAQISWTNLGASPPGYKVEWWPLSAPASVNEAYTTVMQYTLTGLVPETDYAVRVTSLCNAPACAGVSQIRKIRTNCELREPNNTLATAAAINFDANIDGNNIYPAGDVDYFKFVPTGCDIVEIKVDHPEIDYFPNPDPYAWQGYDLPYKLYDQNFQEVPVAKSGYVDDSNRWHDNVHWVVPGQQYYIEVKGWLPTWQNLSCYIVNAFPCYDCDDIASNAIFGKDKVYTVPSTHNYSFSDPAFHVQWSVSGPANIQPNGWLCPVNFTGVGTVVLTGTITRCDGTSATFQKEILVSDECDLEGEYTVGNSSVELSETGFNFIQDWNYTVTLDIPDGSNFNVYLNSGTGTWTVDGTKIYVQQSSPLLTLRVVLFTGVCHGETGIYTFYHGGDYPPYPPDYPVDWYISPNPATYTLQINPVINPAVNSSLVPESVDIRLFNQYTNLVLLEQGSTSSPTNLNTAGLTPGLYNLQLIYGEYIQYFNIIKQ